MGFNLTNEDLHSLGEQMLKEEADMKKGKNHFLTPMLIFLSPLIVMGCAFSSKVVIERHTIKK